MTYETDNIRLFLQLFDDQTLANFQAACEDNRVRIAERCYCIIGFFNHNVDGQYGATRDHVKYASLAEREFAHLGYPVFHGVPSHRNWTNPKCDARRNAAVLPLIADEWKRREAERLTTQPEVAVVKELA